MPICNSRRTVSAENLPADSQGRLSTKPVWDKMSLNWLPNYFDHENKKENFIQKPQGRCLFLQKRGHTRRAIGVRDLMNEIHSMEICLRGWQPRRTSAGLKRRLFGRPVHFKPKLAWAVGWLAPVTAFALFALSVFISENNFPGSSPGHHPMLVSPVNHQRFREPAPAGRQPGSSNLLSGVFDLNNGSVPASSITTFACSRMN